MTDSKHTKGPWRVEDGTTLIWGDCNPDDLTTYGMGYPIAECRLTPISSWAKGPKKYEEAEANARLIAASPDLLEVLVELMETLRKEAPGTPLNNHRFDALGIKAYAAIAKAGG